MTEPMTGTSLLMEASPPSRATLVDLLDRVLDKGLVIYADIIISVAGVPLLGVNLRAALAGMETMTRYGMMKEWDEQIRAEALPVEERAPTRPDPVLTEAQA